MAIRIFTAPRAAQDTIILQAYVGDWQELLPHIRSLRTAAKEVSRKIRDLAPNDVVQVTLSNEDAAKVIDVAHTRDSGYNPNTAETALTHDILQEE